MNKVKIKKGNNVTTVPLNSYEANYKPYGWEIVETNVINVLDEELNQKGIVNEKQQEAYIHAKLERKKRHFNDGLFFNEKGD